MMVVSDSTAETDHSGEGLDLRPWVGLHQDEIEQAIQSAPTHRVRALVALRCDTGMWPMTVARLDMSEVHAGEDGYQIQIETEADTKTFEIGFAGPYLEEWLDQHPQPDDPEAPLFTTADGEHPPRPLRVARLTDSILEDLSSP